MRRYVIKEIPEFIKEIKLYGYNKSPVHIPVHNTQARILYFLFRNENIDVNQKDLENEFHLTRSTISSILNTMEKKKLIYRVASDKDARKKYIKLNKLGLSDKDQIIQYFFNIETILTKDIPEEKLNTFFEVLDLMKENIRKGDQNA